MKTMKINFAIVLAALLFSSASLMPGYKVGDVVKDFKLKNVDGKAVSLADYKAAKGYIVIFDCNTCPYSKAYNERIIALNNKYAPKGFPVIAINANDPVVSPGDSFDKMQAQARAKKYEFPYLFDETQEVARAYGATNTPQVFVLQKKDGAKKVAYIGAIDDNTRSAKDVKKRYVEDAVNAILQNKTVPVGKTKAIGCTIKWKRT